MNTLLKLSIFALIVACFVAVVVAQGANNPLPPKGTGTQFITGKCSVDNDCASGCCDSVKKTCRAPLALVPGVEFCGNGFSPNFDGPNPPAKKQGGKQGDGAKKGEAGKNATPPKGTGKQFITGPCSADSDCASGCCEPTKGVCRAPLSLSPGKEFCGNGFTPNFDGNNQAAKQGDGAKKGEAGKNATPPKGAGKQFITGPCSSDSDCASGCCEPTKGVCRAPLSLSPGKEFCGNGFTPNFDGGANKGDGAKKGETGNNVTPPKGTGKQFITGPCSSDSDCASGCCEPKKGVCRAPLSLSPGKEFCGNGFTPNFG